MVDASFRVVPGRLLAALLVAAFIFAGCGGSGAGEQARTLNGKGFRFDAPADWSVRRTARLVAAEKDGSLVQVATFSLLRPYRAALFDRVERELRARMRQVAAQTGGSVGGHEAVTVGGIRSHSYELVVGKQVDRYTFVLKGKREFQLLCRQAESSAGEACSQLLRTFEPA